MTGIAMMCDIARNPGSSRRILLAHLKTFPSSFRMRGAYPGCAGNPKSRNDGAGKFRFCRRLLQRPFEDASPLRERKASLLSKAEPSAWSNWGYARDSQIGGPLARMVLLHAGMRGAKEGDIGAGAAATGDKTGISRLGGLLCSSKKRQMRPCAGSLMYEQPVGRSSGRAASLAASASGKLAA